MPATPKYKVDEILVFNSMSDSGITENDGQRCRIIIIKPADQWFDPNLPQYVIRFLHRPEHGFGVLECELSPDYS